MNFFFIPGFLWWSAPLRYQDNEAIGGNKSCKSAFVAVGWGRWNAANTDTITTNATADAKTLTKRVISSPASNVSGPFLINCLSRERPGNDLIMKEISALSIAGIGHGDMLAKRWRNHWIEKWTIFLFLLTFHNMIKNCEKQMCYENGSCMILACICRKSQILSISIEFLYDCCFKRNGHWLKFWFMNFCYNLSNVKV